MDTLMEHIGQIETALILIFGLVALNYARDGRNMKPSFIKQLQIAFITSTSVILGIFLADLNGLSSVIDGVMKLFIVLYAIATLLVIGQLNPVIKPLIDKLLGYLEGRKK